MQINNRISKLRKKNNIKLEILAKGIVSTSHLSNIESGKYEASLDILELLAMKFQVPDTYLVEHNTIDENLEHILLQFETSIMTNDSKSSTIYQQLKDNYPYINSIFQETKYYILLACYQLKCNLVNDALHSYKNEFLPLIKKLKIPDEIERVQYYFLGGICYFEENYSDSLVYYRRLFDYYNNPSIEGMIDYNIGLVLYKLNLLTDSIESTKKAAEQYFLDKKWGKLGEAYNLIGSIYLKMEELKRAEKYFKLSLVISQNNSLSLLESRTLHNLAIIHKRENNSEKAIQLLTKSIEIKKKLNGNDIVLSYTLLIEVLLNNSELDKASAYIEDIDQIISKLTTINYYQFIIVKGKYMLEIGDFDQCQHYFEEAVGYFLKHQLWKYINLYAEEYGNILFNHRKYKRSSEIYKLKIISEKKL
ncbi:tetratricopeptide repeat protein [Ornithinibacillus salinisoli]|uniref:Tetratricopeptide repeat protein n=1 Tax=Ornithinibacillus salinisoli TaxID=1848459 RepID=A0ABW4VVC4_9BACI